MCVNLKIGSRASPLAVVQVDEVLQALSRRGISFFPSRKTFQTQGDKDKLTALTSSPGDDFFTDTLDQALLCGEIDAAVHSAKDLPKILPDGLQIAALTASLDDKDAWVSAYDLDKLPQGARVGTSSQLRQEQVKEIMPDLRIVDIRGTIQERIQMVKDGQLEGVIVAVCALKRLKLDKEIRQVFPWDGTPLQGQLAVVVRQGDEPTKKLFEPIDVRRGYGRVVLVGAGPGDPELITLKGIAALAQADCVFYDYLTDETLLKYAPKAEHIYAGKRKGIHILRQEELNKLLKEKAVSGKRVVRLKGGDPLIFGRGAEEIEYLRSYHIEVDVVPGISSATGVFSSLGVPLTARGSSSSVAFVSGHGEGEFVKTRPVVIPKADTLVFLMGLTKLNDIITGLKSAGWSEDAPVLVVSKGCRPDERVIKGTVATIGSLVAKEQPPLPAIFIVGKTVDLYRPREQKTFIHCGTQPDAYARLGKIIHLPLIQIKAVDLTQEQRRAISREFEASDVIICTSRYAVTHFIQVLLSADPLVDLKGKVFVSIGRHTTQALAEYKVDPKIIALEETAKGLFAAIIEQMDVKSKRMLFPRSSIPNPFLKEALTAKGALVHEITVYENTKPPKKDLPQGQVDGVIFTSPSTVRNFISDYGKIPQHWQIIAKGPVTALELQKYGVQNFRRVS